MSGLIGQHLGQYEIVALLGKGGMATVYRARQQSVARDVAVKVIKPDLAEAADFVKRFEQEAKTVASLSHLHILKVFDYGEQGDVVYLVTELLPGGSLAELIEKGPLSLELSGKLLDQIASALDHAHRKGIIHRDLKPQNVLLDDHGNVFLTDFGIAKILNQSSALTQSGAALGTPSYMAPEQWSGQTIDARTDIYALGIMLFEMLTGQVPFTADTPFTMMHMHIYEPPPPLRGVRPDLPAQIEQVITKALAKDREQRFESASALAAAFKAGLSGNPQTIVLDAEQPTRSPAKSRGAGARPVLGSNRSALIGIAVVVVAVLLVGAILAALSTGRTASQSTATPESVAVVATTEPTAPGTLTTAEGTAVSVVSSGPPITASNASKVSERATVTGHELDVNCAVFSPDGTLFATASDDKSVRLWDVATWTQKTVMEGHTDRTRCVAFSPNGTLLASAGLDQLVRLWDVKTGNRQAVLDGHAGDVNSVAFSPDGSLVASGGRDKTARLWDVATAKERSVLKGHTDFVRGVAFSPDGKVLVSVSFDKTVRLWDVKTGKEQAVLQEQDSKINGVAFSPDGTLFATASDDATVRLWDIKTGKVQASLKGHTSRVFGVAFSPDGSLVASAGADKTIHIWDVKTGSEMIVLKGHGDSVRSVAFSPNGSLLISASSDKTVRLWGIPQS